MKTFENLLIPFDPIPISKDFTCKQMMITSVKEGPKFPILFYPCSDAVIRMFNLNDGMGFKTLNGHFTSVQCVSLHEKRVELYSGANDLLVWTPRLGSELEVVNID